VCACAEGIRPILLFWWIRLAISLSLYEAKIECVEKPPSCKRKSALLTFFFSIVCRTLLRAAAPAPSRPVSYVVSVALGVMLLCSAVLNVAQYAGAGGAAGAAPGQMAKLGWGSFGPRTHTFARMEDPQRDGRCNNGLVHMCIDEASAASSATAAAASLGGDNNGGDGGGGSVRIAKMGQSADGGFTPGEDAVQPAEGGARYCRKDTWLLSCLFYKADVNDELTDWKSVKSECDREPLCDGVNKVGGCTSRIQSNRSLKPPGFNP
jgi:hypothetical protein